MHRDVDVVVSCELISYGLSTVTTPIIFKKLKMVQSLRVSTSFGIICSKKVRLGNDRRWKQLELTLLVLHTHTHTHEATPPSRGRRAFADAPFFSSVKLSDGPDFTCILDDTCIPTTSLLPCEREWIPKLLEMCLGRRCAGPGNTSNVVPQGGSRAGQPASQVRRQRCTYSNHPNGKEKILSRGRA
jgi:hypothetical protein